MATVTEMRAALKERYGDEVPERGRLTDDWRARYDAIETEQRPGTDDDWDLTGDDDILTADELEPSVPMTPERPPRSPRAARKERRAQPVGQRLFGKREPKTPAARKAKLKRISVEHLISRTWEGVARFAQPLSLPVSRCLQVQSPVAGMILEEIVAGTVVDRALQPIARAEEKAQKVLALVGPPLLVLAIEQSTTLPPQQMAMRQALLVPMLKESLRIWLQVAGPKVEEAAKREAEYQQTFGKSIDELMALFFGPAEAQTTAEQVAPEMAGAAA
jgi:hypothetical protein